MRLRESDWAATPRVLRWAARYGARRCSVTRCSIINERAPLIGPSDFQRETLRQFTLVTDVEKRYVGNNAVAAIDDAKKVVLDVQVRRRSR